MSLDWNVSKVENHSTVCFDEEMNIRPVTKALVFLTELIGIPVITDENQYEFFQRCRLYEKHNGARMWQVDPDDSNKQVERWIGLGDIRSHIGLRTNARRLTAAKFKDEAWDSVMAEIIRDQKTEVTLLCSESRTTAATPAAQ